MTDPKPAALHRVLAAIAVLGTAETRDIATQAAMAYSTVTPKLRALEGDGLAERVTDNGKSLWRLTPAGLLAAAVTSDAPTEDARPGLDATTADDAPDADAAPQASESPDDGDAPESDDNSGAAEDTADSEPETPQQPVPAVDDAVIDGGAATVEDPIAAAAEPEDASIVPAQPDTQICPRPTPDSDQPADDGDLAVPESSSPPAATADGEAAAATPKPRRRGGTLRDAALDALRTLGPSKVGAVCKAIDAANAEAGTTAAKASPGAVRNALDKLTEDGLATLVAERPAIFAAI